MGDSNKIPEIDMSMLEGNPLFESIKELMAASQTKVESLYHAGQLNEDSDLSGLSEDILKSLAPEHLACLLDVGMERQREVDSDKSARPFSEE